MLARALMTRYECLRRFPIHMLIYPILAALFAAGVIANLLRDPPDWPNVWVGGGIALVLISMWLWLKMNVRKWREALDWLGANRRHLTDQPQYFCDSPFPMTPVSKGSKLRNFKVVTSCLVFTSTHDTGADLRSPMARGALASLWTLMFGWWGIPWGPLRTVQALLTNFSGGEVTLVSDAVADETMDLEDQPEPGGT
ncbi:MAG: hypothetical protein ACR2RV_26450 [Verrucomicrobiales bacterium]